MTTTDLRRRLTGSRWLPAVLAVVVIAGIGSYFLAPSHAQSPPKTPAVANSLLKPYSLGTAPYQYVAYSGSLEETRAATGVKQLFAAFIIDSGSCMPSWGGAPANGLVSPRGTAIAADITQLRAAGAEVTVSFGGSNGVELAASCPAVPELTQAYDSVINDYNLKQVDFDIEGAMLTNAEGNARRAAAIANLERTHPDLKVWVTLPVHTMGLTPPGIAVLKQLRDHGVVISGVNIMAMNYNIKSTDMGGQAIRSAQASHGQLAQLYPNNSNADIWKGLGVTVMAGKNNTVPETFTLANAAQLRSFAVEKGIGMLSLWNAGRDVACAPGSADNDATSQPSIACSGVEQEPYAFLRALTIAPRD